MKIEIEKKHVKLAAKILFVYILLIGGIGLFFTSMVIGNISNSNSYIKEEARKQAESLERLSDSIFADFEANAEESRKDELNYQKWQREKKINHIKNRIANVQKLYENFGKYAKDPSNSESERASFRQDQKDLLERKQQLESELEELKSKPLVFE